MIMHDMDDEDDPHANDDEEEMMEDDDGIDIMDDDEGMSEMDGIVEEEDLGHDGLNVFLRRNRIEQIGEDGLMEPVF